MWTVLYFISDWSHSVVLFTDFFAHEVMPVNIPKGLSIFKAGMLQKADTEKCSMQTAVRRQLINREWQVVHKDQHSRMWMAGFKACSRLCWFVLLLTSRTRKWIVHVDVEMSLKAPNLSAVRCCMHKSCQVANHTNPYHYCSFTPLHSFFYIRLKALLRP